MNTITEILKKPGTVVIDVRTPLEFLGGHITGSINIPLHEVPHRLAEFKQMQNVVVCCASGMRSQKATEVLKQNGIACFDAGSWVNVKACLNNF